MEIKAIILAAGNSKRMRSAKSKVLHKISGSSLIEYPLRLMDELGVKRSYVVTPKMPNEISNFILKSHYKAEPTSQVKALGTANAVACCEKELKDFLGYVLILCGDTPLLQIASLKKLVSAVAKKKKELGLLTTEVPNPKGYGRIIRNIAGKISSIVEEKELEKAQERIAEINTGIFCVKASWLFKSLQKIKKRASSGEYYLTDIVSIAIAEGLEVEAVLEKNYQDFLGINTREELAKASAIMQKRSVKYWLSKGVSFISPAHTYLDEGISIGQDSLIYPNVFLQGKTKIGKNCLIEAGAVLKDVVLGDGVHVKPYCVLESCNVANDSQVGPFARLRPGADLKKGVRIGNFVEVKNSQLGSGVKINHLAYIGDASVGNQTNIGCGTITCNYDGKNKHKTKIGSDVFVGSDVQFVAPVKVGKGAVIGAGSTITQDVPSGSLALARQRQINKKGWANGAAHKKRK